MYEVVTDAAIQALSHSFGLTNALLDWHRPQDHAHGDISTAAALRLGRQVGKSPQEMAQVLCDALSKLPDVQRAEVAGPGYVNVWLTPTALLRELSRAREACTAKVKRKEPPVVIDYSAPNIAKPLAECSLDDLLALYVRFHDEVGSDTSLEDQAREAFKKIEGGDTKLRAFWKEVVHITVEALERLYERLHVSFDYTHGESFYEDKMQPIIEEGKKKRVFAEGEEGALVVRFPEESQLSPAIVLKADDATIYLTRDLATARYRIDTFHPQKILYVVDVAQQYYFKQLFATLS